jgi:hypothetical protein
MLEAKNIPFGCGCFAPSQNTVITQCQNQRRSPPLTSNTQPPRTRSHLPGKLCIFAIAKLSRSEDSGNDKEMRDAMKKYVLGHFPILATSPGEIIRTV